MEDEATCSLWALTLPLVRVVAVVGLERTTSSIAKDEEKAD